MNRRLAAVAAVLGASLVAGGAGCGSAPAPARPAQLQRVTVALASDVLTMAPLFVADGEGFYRQKGLEVKIAEVGGTDAVQAVSSGNVEFSTNDAGTLAAAALKGNGNILAVETLVNAVTLNLVLGNAVVERLHLRRQTPLEQRFQALRGLRLGVISPSGAVNIFTRYFLQRGGLNPDKDAKIIVIGATPLLIAAMKNGEIDGFLSSPPAPEQAEAQGAGKVVISTSEGDVPELANMVYQSVVTSKEYAKTHPDVVRAFAQATAMANDLIRKDPSRAQVDIDRHFSKVQPALLQQSMQHIAPAVPLGGLCTEQGWAAALRIDKQIGLFKGDPSPQEGVLWTNQYVQGPGGGG